MTNPRIRVDASRVMNRITNLMTGSCIEDVNHEIYGGLYAQMIFGESFEEPPDRDAPVGWRAYDGRWHVESGACTVDAIGEAKLVREEPELRDGVVECEIMLLDDTRNQVQNSEGANASLILRVQTPRTGPDNWIGYEVALNSRPGYLRLARHRNDYQLVQDEPFSLRAGAWCRVRVELKGPTIRVFARDMVKPMIEWTDKTAPVLSGRVGLRTWRGGASFRDLRIRAAGREVAEAFRDDPASGHRKHISGLWDSLKTGSAVCEYHWDDTNAFNTTHSQKLSMAAGEGTVGITNRGLNRWGLTVRNGKEYAGRLYLRQQDYDGTVTVALTSCHGNAIYARQSLAGIGRSWECRDFALRPDTDDSNARFALWIEKPGGAVWVDQVVLMPTGDELFHGLPVRADIAKVLVDQGLTVLRYGGCMVNAPQYRWKHMIGDRDKRPQYAGWWYPHSTNGFGIEDFVQFCRAAGFEPVVSICAEETPEDAADLVEYLNGPAGSQWGSRRAENGHPEPYRVKYLQIGNEEKTDEVYLERYKRLHAAMQPRDPSVLYIIAAWFEPDNPVTRRIVEELRGKAALWDLHVGGDGLKDGEAADEFFTKVRRLIGEWTPGNPLKACVLEENGGRHDLQRALGHARILNAAERHGDFVVIDCPANCLQPYRQNDNGWDQGQVFFTSGQVWAMPPYYAQQMAAANYLPHRVFAETTGSKDLDVTATRSEDGRQLVLKVVSISSRAQRADIRLEGFGGPRPEAKVWTLSGRLNDRNTPEEAERIRPRQGTARDISSSFRYEFPAHSYTILRFERQ